MNHPPVFTVVAILTIEPRLMTFFQIDSTQKKLYLETHSDGTQCSYAPTTRHDEPYHQNFTRPKILISPCRRSIDYDALTTTLASLRPIASHLSRISAFPHPMQPLQTIVYIRGESNACYVQRCIEVCSELYTTRCFRRH